jgi:hypothetical protein
MRRHPTYPHLRAPLDIVLFDHVCIECEKVNKDVVGFVDYYARGKTIGSVDYVCPHCDEVNEDSDLVIA